MDAKRHKFLTEFLKQHLFIWNVKSGCRCYIIDFKLSRQCDVLDDSFHLVNKPSWWHLPSINDEFLPTVPLTTTCCIYTSHLVDYLFSRRKLFSLTLCLLQDRWCHISNMILHLLIHDQTYASYMFINTVHECITCIYVVTHNVDFAQPRGLGNWCPRKIGLHCIFLSSYSGIMLTLFTC